jgi:hypothetical protein
MLFAESGTWSFSMKSPFDWRPYIIEFHRQAPKTFAARAFVLDGRLELRLSGSGQTIEYALDEPLYPGITSAARLKEWGEELICRLLSKHRMVEREGMEAMRKAKEDWLRGKGRVYGIDFGAGDLSVVTVHANGKLIDTIPLSGIPPQAPAPPPRAFVVGDEVEFLAWGEMRRGFVTKREDGRLWLDVKVDGQIWPINVDENTVASLTLIKPFLPPAEQKPEPKLKVGDRVRVADRSGEAGNKIGVVMELPEQGSKYYLVAIEGFRSQARSDGLWMLLGCEMMAEPEMHYAYASTIGAGAGRGRFVCVVNGEPPKNDEEREMLKRFNEAHACRRQLRRRGRRFNEAHASLASSHSSK